MTTKICKTCEQVCLGAVVLAAVSLLLSIAALAVCYFSRPAAAPTVFAPGSTNAAAPDTGTPNGFAAIRQAIFDVASPSPEAAGQTGTCTAERRGIASFACPGTPTGDICGEPPLLSCYLGPDESCPEGQVWDPRCTCICIPRPR